MINILNQNQIPRNDRRIFLIAFDPAHNISLQIIIDRQLLELHRHFSMLTKRSHQHGPDIFLIHRLLFDINCISSALILINLSRVVTQVEPSPFFHPSILIGPKEFLNSFIKLATHKRCLHCGRLRVCYV